MIDGPADKIIDTMVERGAWCVGTPDDLVAAIKRLDEASGGYGGLLIQTTEWSTREQMLHSYELVARYVMPQFQGSLVNLQQSQALSAQIPDRTERHAVRCACAGAPRLPGPTRPSLSPGLPRMGNTAKWSAIRHVSFR